MARRGLATALQAALAGFGGYGQGVIAQRERAQKQQAEKEAKEARDFEAILGIKRSGLKRLQPGVQEPGYESVGTFRGVEYGAPTPETQARLEQEAATSSALRSATAQETVRQQMFTKNLPVLRKVLDELPKGLITGAERNLIESGKMTDAQVAGLITSRTDAMRRPQTAPTDPNIARQRQLGINRQEAQTYVEAFGGDVEKAFAAYKMDNPTGTISRRDFDAAATRLNRGMGADAAISQFLTGINFPLQ